MLAQVWPTAEAVQVAEDFSAQLCMHKKRKTQQATAQQQDNNNTNNERMHSPLAHSSPANLPAYLPLRRRRSPPRPSPASSRRSSLATPSIDRGQPLPKFCRGRQRPEIERRPLPLSLLSLLLLLSHQREQGIIVRAPYAAAHRQTQRRRFGVSLGVFLQIFVQTS